MSMGIRLYDSAWVLLEGRAEPFQVRKGERNPAVFNVAEYQYDIDGRAMKSIIDAPTIVRLHTLQSAREAGLRIAYDRDIYPDV